MGKDDEWITVTKKTTTGRPRMNTGEASKEKKSEGTQQPPLYSGQRSKAGPSLTKPSGAFQSVEKKYNAGTNKQRKQTTSARKLEEEDETFRHEKVPREWGLAIVQERQKKNITREDLARMVNEKATVIADIENGKAILNNAMIAKIERALGAKVRRKK